MSPLAALIHPLNWSFRLFFRTSCYVAQSPFHYDGVRDVALIVRGLERIQRLRVTSLSWSTITILYKFDRRPHSFFFLSSKLEKASTYAGSNAMCHLPRSDSVRSVFARQSRQPNAMYHVLERKNAPTQCSVPRGLTNKQRETSKLRNYFSWRE